MRQRNRIQRGEVCDGFRAHKTTGIFEGLNASPCRSLEFSPLFVAVKVVALTRTKGVQDILGRIRNQCDPCNPSQLREVTGQTTSRVLDVTIHSSGKDQPVGSSSFEIYISSPPGI